jgi:hypothetical protein
MVSTLETVLSFYTFALMQTLIQHLNNLRERYLTLNAGYAEMIRAGKTQKELATLNAEINSLLLLIDSIETEIENKKKLTGQKS